MYEVELKIKTDHETVRPRLESLGAELHNQVQQVDSYFDAPHREFAVTDEALRVRTEESDRGTTTEFTYKGPLVEEASKTREELTTEVADPDATKAILGALGFEHRATVRKQRERFAHEGFTLTLDTVDGLGEFVEIETEVDTEADVEDARERAVDVLQTLGIEADEQIRTSYLGLLLAESE